MKKAALDQAITEVFKREVAELSIDDRVKRNIDEALASSAHKEEKGMKHFSMKKIAMVGIASVLLTVSAVFASGQVSSLISSSNPFTACKDYSKLSKIEEELGYSVKVTERFSNGYNFEKMQVVKVKGVDDAGNVVATYKDLDVDYVNEAGNSVSLNATQRSVGEAFRTPVKTLQCDDTMLYYYQDTYKSVPEGYELTEEDKRNAEREDYEISVGSKEVRTNIMSFVVWEREGVKYHLLATDTEMTPDEMLVMASEAVKK